MTTTKELQNKPLISLTDGKKIGEIKDLYLDSEATQVGAVLVGREGIISRKAMVVDRAAIQVFGSDVWLVKGSDVVTEYAEEEDKPHSLLLGNLCGREITTDGGTRLGTVGDVLLDSEARVLGFTLGKVYVKGPLAEKSLSFAEQSSAWVPRISR